MSGAVGCCAVISVSLSGDGIGSATVVSGGVGYASAPTLTVSGGGGRGASLTATISGGVVASVTVDSAGSDYTQAPSVVVLATELLSPANDPPNIGEYTMQGKGETELDPESVACGSWSSGTYGVSSARTTSSRCQACLARLVEPCYSSTLEVDTVRKTAVVSCLRLVKPTLMGRSNQPIRISFRLVTITKSLESPFPGARRRVTSVIGTTPPLRKVIGCGVAMSATSTTVKFQIIRHSTSKWHDYHGP